MNAKKILVTYFSCSHVTEAVAQRLSQLLHADLFEIKPETPYTEADLDWHDAKSRSTIEMNDPSSRPAIAEKLDTMDQYDVVLVGFPIWWHTAPTIISTFLESYDFSGKTMVPFFTSGGGGAGKSDEDMHAACAGTATWKPSHRLTSADSDQELSAWIDSLAL